MKARIRVIILGFIIVFMGLSGFLFYFIKNVEEINFTYMSYPLGKEEMIYSETMSDIREISIDAHNFDVRFIEDENIDEVKIEIYSSDIIQEYVESITVTNEDGLITLTSKPQVEVLYDHNNEMENIKNNLILAKKLAYNYHNELKNNNIIIPEINSFNYSIFIIVHYPKGYTFENITVSSNQNWVLVNNHVIQKEYVLDYVNL